MNAIVNKKVLKVYKGIRCLWICYCFYLILDIKICLAQPADGAVKGGIPDCYFSIGGSQSIIYANPFSEMYAKINISNNSPVCLGDTIKLFGSSLAGDSYTWSGPDSFSSTTQNPVLPATPFSEGVYTLTVELSSGCKVSTNTFVSVNGCGNALSLYLMVFIEGYYLGMGQMQPLLFNLELNNDPTACDSINVELHSGVFPFSTLASIKTILHSDGTLHALFSPLFINQSCYIVIKQRNTLETWSHIPVLLNASEISYDFSDSVSRAFGNNLADLGDGRFAMLSGDVNQNGIINTSDFSFIENNTQLFLSGYLADDLTGDVLIESADYSLIENNLGKILIRP